MIRHIVLIKFRPDIPEGDIAALFQELATLTDSLSGAHGFTGGRSESPEQLEQGYLHGFVIDFDDWASLQVYADHPEHQALGARLVAMAQDGVNGLVVLDLNIAV